MPRSLHGHYVLFKAPEEFALALPKAASIVSEGTPPPGFSQQDVLPKGLPEVRVKLADFVSKVHKAGDYLVGIFHLGGPDGIGNNAPDAIYFVGPDRHNIETAAEVEESPGRKTLKVFTVRIDPRHVLDLKAALPEHEPQRPVAV